MDNFTPYSALIGGILIGISVSVLLYFNGRIAGISGILSGTVFAERGEWQWRLLFLIGMIAGAIAYQYWTSDVVDTRTGFPLPLLIVGGLLVGFGTRMGSGCTSGHGICGIARISQRSMIATCIFILCGGLSVFIVRHIAGIVS